MNSFELTTSINTLANTIACKLSDEEITLIASIFVQLGDTLATIVAHRTFCEDRLKTNNALV